MTILEIVTTRLTDGGFDGLYNTTCDCACRLGDLAPCQGFQDDCTPGYLLPDDFDEPDDYNWRIGPNKPKQDKTP